MYASKALAWLYISKIIIEFHGGKIWAENNSDGKEATFTFTLSIPIRNPAGVKDDHKWIKSTETRVKSSCTGSDNALYLHTI